MKTIITAVAAAGLLSLTACGGGTDTANTSGADNGVAATGLENEAANIGEAANTQVDASTNTLGSQLNQLENGAGDAADAAGNSLSNAANATGNAAGNVANAAGNTL